MISCKDARHLFDRYLDGELAASLQTELHAHRLNCTECQNELAMMEACGDVITLDHREPRLSASFTDRVLLARRAQLRPVRRQWGRTLLFIGSPMAAAASIALAVLLIAPTKDMPYKTATLGKIEYAQPNAGTETAQADLAQADIPVGLLENFVFAPLVDKSRDAVQGTVRSASELANWIHLGLAEPNYQFADQRPASPSSESTPATQQPDPQQAPNSDLPNCAYEPL